MAFVCLKHFRQSGFVVRLNQWLRLRSYVLVGLYAYARECWQVHHMPRTWLASIWWVVIASTKRVYAWVLVTTFSCVCMAMQVHLTCIRALHEQRVTVTAVIFMVLIFHESLMCSLFTILFSWILLISQHWGHVVFRNL